MKNTIIFCLIFLTTRVFGEENLVSEKTSILTPQVSQQLTIKIEENNKVAEEVDATLAVERASCTPPDGGDLAEKLYEYTKNHNEWYFHKLGCDEDILSAKLMEYSAKSRLQLEECQRQPLCSAERDMVDIALRQRINEEDYNKCLQKIATVRNSNSL